MKSKEAKAAYMKAYREQHKSELDAYMKSWRDANREYINTTESERRKNNPNYTKQYMDNFRERKYGLTPAEYKAMLDRQNNHCAICQAEGNLHVDHCHSTNKVRGLLCSSCNNGLGRFKDNSDNLRRAADYLERK